MVLLPRAFEQRLVGRLLDEAMLKALGSLGGQPLLLEHFRLD